jgi:hypothetical protein
MIAAGAAAMAVWLGWLVAGGSYVLPALAGIAAIAVTLVFLTSLSAEVVLLGLVLIGYLVGNRGFAQFMPFPGLPLLPAEIALGATGGWLLVKCAFARRPPWEPDMLNWTVLAWMLIGTARVLFDLPHYGMLAIRDFAMIYYAGFFFVAQSLSADERSRRFLCRCLVVGGILLPPVFAAYESFSEFFFRTLTLHGVPLVYYKGDLLETFMSVCAVTIFFAAKGRHRYWAWPFAVLVLLQVFGSESRASILGALSSLVWLLLARRPLFPALQAGAAVLAFGVVVLLASVGENTWARERLDGLGDRVNSLSDAYGQRSYESNESSDKGDNNRFRIVWWGTVAKETLDQAPVCGLGFGYDLAKGFMQTYDPAMGDDFAARSPHSIIMSVFGRMGSIGLAAFLTFVGALMVKTWRSLRNRSTDPVAVGLWCAAWVILTSACFGVVLEGPMGAVLFWSVLGLANGMAPAERELEKVAGPAPQISEETDAAAA